MKKILLPVLCAIVLSTSAQTFVSVIDENHTWKEQVVGFTTIHSTYWFDGDSVVNGQAYKVLYSIVSLFPDNIYYYGMYREDAETQQVFVLWNGVEKLVYDFSLEQGDMITIYPQGDPISATVQSVDTETVGGESRKRINFDLGGYTDSWVMGMGSVLGIATPMISFPDNVPQLNCFYIGNNLAWGNPLYEGVCDPFLEEEVAVSEKIKLNSFGPNPASDELIFSFDRILAGGNVRIQLYNLVGEKVLDENFASRESIHVELPVLNDGIYLVRVQAGLSSLITQRVVIRQP